MLCICFVAFSYIIQNDGTSLHRKLQLCRLRLLLGYMRVSREVIYKKITDQLQDASGYGLTLSRPHRSGRIPANVWGVMAVKRGAPGLTTGGGPRTLVNTTPMDWTEGSGSLFEGQEGVLGICTGGHYGGSLLTKWEPKGRSRSNLSEWLSSMPSRPAWE